MISYKHIIVLMQSILHTDWFSFIMFTISTSKTRRSRGVRWKFVTLIRYFRNSVFFFFLLYWLFNEPVTSKVVKANSLKWAGHMERMGEERVVKMEGASQKKEKTQKEVVEGDNWRLVGKTSTRLERKSKG